MVNTVFSTEIFLVSHAYDDERLINIADGVFVMYTNPLFYFELHKIFSKNGSSMIVSLNTKIRKILR